MHSVTVVVAALAASQMALARPMQKRAATVAVAKPVAEAPPAADAAPASSSAASSIKEGIAGGAASGLALSLFNSLFNRELDERGAVLTPDQKMQLLHVIGSKIQAQKREPLSLPKLGSTGEAVAGGVASAAGLTLFNNLLSGLFSREELEARAAPVAEAPPAAPAASTSTLGSNIAGGVASGAALSFLNSLFSREELEARAPLSLPKLSSTGEAIAGGVASAAGLTAFNTLLSGLFSRELELDARAATVAKPVAEAPPAAADAAPATSGLGSAVAGGVASAAALSFLNSLFSREELDARAPLSLPKLSSTGEAIAGGVASAAGLTAFNTLLNGLFSRELELDARAAAVAKPIAEAPPPPVVEAAPPAVDTAAPPAAVDGAASLAASLKTTLAGTLAGGATNAFLKKLLNRELDARGAVLTPAEKMQVLHALGAKLQARTASLNDLD